MRIEESIKSRARALGFDLVGIATLGPAETAPMFEEWIARGFAGDMAYLERGAEKRADPRRVFENVKSAVVVGMNYGGKAPPGPVARYARGDDYHDVMTARLRELHAWLQTELGRDIAGKAYVDTGPILERDLARKAGLGWFGKNTMLLNPEIGSFFFLGALLLDLELEPDAPFEADRCGTCTRCLDACPTDAFVAPRVLDATRCISYLTIELKTEIPSEFHGAIGENIYGCDICQDVCPWNVRFATDAREPAFAARQGIAGKDARTLALQILGMDDATFRAAFRKSPMKRAKLQGLKRNAAVVLNNLSGFADTEAGKANERAGRSALTDVSF
ncbi:MAG: tRNA epoxyqueuosine(34) reductase QueG [Gemmatimonadaceae bacterium]|nr:tRNA epoxyqueuosine(34) reductase QueG [Gemmatimonadaceae bacterium]